MTTIHLGADDCGGADDPVRADVLARALLVVPCLNEERHIEGLLAQLRRVAGSALIVVADGGSTDATLAILARHEGNDPRVRVLHNPRRIQSSAINLAVERFGAGRDVLVRIDAHCLYPDDYLAVLLAERERTGADAVVVSMDTRGEGGVQAANAAAQNSRLGNGGAPHRAGGDGRWVDHGHHALMSLDAFRAVGGYDETFAHNEDAELDHRLRRAGRRIWLTARTRALYVPRDTLGGLFRQYRNYGRGRARNVLKHRLVPRVRQALPLLVAPAAGLGVLGAIALWPLPPLGLVLLAPVALWAAMCLGGGLWLAARARRASLALAGVSAMVMHFAWSLGFWRQIGAALGGRA